MRRLLASRLVVFWSAVVVGASGLAGVLGGLGAALLPDDPSLVALGLGTMAIAVVARETIGPKTPIPQIRWQVPQEWLRRPWVGALAFGSIMGMGVFTLQRSALFHLYLLGCFGSGSFGRGAVFGFVYGITYVAASLRGLLETRVGEPGLGVDWVASAWERARWVGVAAAPLIVFLPYA